MPHPVTLMTQSRHVTHAHACHGARVDESSLYIWRSQGPSIWRSHGRESCIWRSHGAVSAWLHYSFKCPSIWRSQGPMIHDSFKCKIYDHDSFNCKTHDHYSWETRESWTHDSFKLKKSWSWILHLKESWIMSHGVMSLAFEGVMEHTYPTEQGGAARTHASNEWHACVCERECVHVRIFIDHSSAFTCVICSLAFVIFR